MTVSWRWDFIDSSWNSWWAMLWGVDIRIKNPVGFVSIWVTQKNSVVGSLHFSVFHKIVIIISGPRLSSFLYLPDINQRKCQGRKCGIYWGNENWWIPYSSAKLSFPSVLSLQQCLHQPGSSSVKKSDTGPSFEAFAVWLNQILWKFSPSIYLL